MSLRVVRFKFKNQPIFPLMGLFKTVLSIIGLVLFLLVIAPVLIALVGLMVNFWYGIYMATYNALGPGNPLTMVTYYIYEFAEWASVVSKYGFSQVASHV